VTPELEEVDALIAKGDLKKALKKIESARKKAEQIKTIQWNLDFLQGKAPVLQAQSKASEASAEDEEPQVALPKRGVVGTTDHPQAERIAEPHVAGGGFASAYPAPPSGCRRHSAEHCKNGLAPTRRGVFFAGGFRGHG
jgi:hypothetical protein